VRPGGTGACQSALSLIARQKAQNCPVGAEFAEEFIFRGYLTWAILLTLKKPLLAAVSGLLFGALHIANGVPQAINALLFGIICSLIAIRMGGIALTSGIHMINNCFGAVMAVSARDVFKGSSGFVAQNAPQLMWWDLGLSSLALIGIGWLVLGTKVLRLVSET